MFINVLWAERRHNTGLGGRLEGERANLSVKVARAETVTEETLRSLIVSGNCSGRLTQGRTALRDTEVSDTTSDRIQRVEHASRETHEQEHEQGSEDETHHIDEDAETMPFHKKITGREVYITIDFMTADLCRRDIRA